MDYHLPHHLYASIPHYNLKRLHEVLLQNPDYAREGVVVEGYLGRVGALESRPSVLDVLGARGAAARSRSGEVYIDHHALDDAEVSDAAAIARQAELSARNA
jgi:fatty acid desaturase